MFILMFSCADLAKGFEMGMSKKGSGWMKAGLVGVWLSGMVASFDVLAGAAPMHGDLNMGATVISGVQVQRSMAKSENSPSKGSGVGSKTMGSAMSSQSSVGSEGIAGAQAKAIGNQDGLAEVCASIKKRYAAFEAKCGGPFECEVTRVVSGQDCRNRMEQYELCRKELRIEQEDLTGKCAALGGRSASGSVTGSSGK